MFDLNLNIFSRYQNNRHQQEEVEESSSAAVVVPVPAITQTTPDHVQLSGTSTSSIVNTTDDRDSNHSSSALNFDVFTKLRTTDVDDEDDDGEEVAGGRDPWQQQQQQRQPEFSTRQLFPVDEGRGGFGGGIISCEGGNGGGILQPAGESQWLKLSVSGEVSDEMKILQQQKQQQVRRSRRGPRSRSSQYRGVTFYRRTGRWESHIWDCGKQVYLGGFDTAHAAARAYDRAAIKFRGVDADINFNVVDYDEDMKQMKNLTKEEFVHVLRRQSTGFARGNSRFRGANSQRCGRWETWMGQYLGKKAYDQAALQYGYGEVTPFDPSNYEMRNVPSEASNGGNADNLDLTLGMSVPVVGANGNNNVGDFYYQNAFYQSTNGKTPVMGNAYYHPGVQVQALHGQPMPSRPPTASTTHERSTIHHERKAGASAASSTRWAWNAQMLPPGQGMISGSSLASPLSVPIPLFSNDTSSGAASSGFSFSRPSSSNLQFNHFS